MFSIIISQIIINKSYLRAGNLLNAQQSSWTFLKLRLIWKTAQNFLISFSIRFHKYAFVIPKVNFNLDGLCEIAKPETEENHNVCAFCFRARSRSRGNFRAAAGAGGAVRSTCHKPRRQLPCLRLFNCFANLALLFVLLLLLCFCCCSCLRTLSIWLCFLAQTRGFLLTRGQVSVGREQEWEREREIEGVRRRRHSNCRIFCVLHICVIFALVLFSHCVSDIARQTLFCLAMFYYFYCLRDA